MITTTHTNLEGRINQRMQDHSYLISDLVFLFFKKHHCERKYSEDEALCDAYIGLWKAATSYTPTKGKAFRSWAWGKIMYELQTGLRRNLNNRLHEQCWTDVEYSRAQKRRRDDGEEIFPELARHDGIEAFILQEFLTSLQQHLSLDQKDLFLRHYILEESATALAHQRNTSKRALCYRLKTIRKKLQPYKGEP